MILASSNSSSNRLAAAAVDSEQRRIQRHAADFAVAIETTDREPVRGWAVDIGLGGMFIEIEEPPRYATLVVVTIDDPMTPHAIRLPAVVRWTTPRGFGVQFDLLGVRETYALLALLSELSRCEEEAVTMTMRRTLCC